MRRNVLLEWNEMKFAQSCLTLCKPMDCSPPGSSVYGILQARRLGWVAIPFSRGSSWARDWTWVSCITCKFFTVWAQGKSIMNFFLNWESSIEIYTLPSIKQVASGKLLYNTGSSARYSVMTQWGGMGVGGMKAQVGGNIYIFMADSLLYSRNQHSIVKQLSSN